MMFVHWLLWLIWKYYCCFVQLLVISTSMAVGACFGCFKGTRPDLTGEGVFTWHWIS